ncbi:MAG TPA: M20/M25/M40 family metallo-hydrolase [Blastocatellia bacterium]|nr:M20/M25/M40 family metallo-hydrolase [Blastocatellia bacterium]
MLHRHFERGLKWATAPVAALLALSLVAGAQVAPAEKVDLDMVAKIKAEGMERSKVMETISHLTDEFGGRLSGSPQLKAANEWTKARLTEWGLQNAHLEGFQFGRGWSLRRFSAHVVEPVAFPLIALPKAWTPGTNGTLSGEAVLTEIQSEADFEKYRGKLKGAFVLTSPTREVKAWFKAPGARLSDEELLKMANDERRGGGRQYSEEQMRAMRARMTIEPKKLEFYRAEGVAALVDLSRAGDGGTLFVQGGGPRDKTAPQALPSIVVTAEHYGRIARLLGMGKKVKLEMNVEAQFHDEDPLAYNTIAEIPGTDLKDEVVMLGAHLDGWHGGTGATDNAAGSAAMMEVLRIVHATGLRPRRTIRIALWGAEEEGLIGSRLYAERYLGTVKEPKPEHALHSAYFNIDNGTGRIRGIWLQNNEAVRPIFAEWIKPLKDLGVELLGPRSVASTDHSSIDGAGVPGFQFIQERYEYNSRTHHSNMDFYDRVQVNDMKQMATVAAVFAWQAANRDGKLPRKTPAGGE